MPAPHDHDAEKSVLGSMLIDSRCIPNVLRRLAATDMHHPIHSELFSLIVGMYHDRIPADVILLTNKLRDAGRLAAIGGPSFVTHLHTFTPTAVNVLYYAEIVREKSHLRQIWQLCGQLHQQAGEPNANPQELGSQLSNLLADLASNSMNYKTMKEHVDEALDRYEAAWENKGNLPAGVIPTGLKALDSALDGGCYPGDFIVISAETSGGKTALAMNIVGSGVLQTGAQALVASYEMKASQLVDRLVSLAASIPANKLRGGMFNESDFARLSSAIGKLRESGIHLRDKIGRWTVDDVASESRALKAQTGLGLVVVDYLQLMAPRATAKGKQANREREVADMSRSLKDLAIELDVPVIALSQLNDDGKLRESRALGHDADVVLTIEDVYADDDPKHKREPIEDQRGIRLNKNRSGARDHVAKVGWVGPLMQFRDL